MIGFKSKKAQAYKRLVSPVKERYQSRLYWLKRIPKGEESPNGGRVRDSSKDRGKAPVVGAITLVRHGEPALSRRVRLDWRGYRDWWAQYELAGLLEGQTPPAILETFARDARYVYSSTLRRAVETAQAVCGERSFEQLEMLVEAPLPPPHLPSFVKFSPNSSGWGFVARSWWWYTNTKEGGETRQQALIRARTAAHFLVEKAREGGDVLVLAHGYFNLLISLELKKMGYIKTLEQGFKYWGCRRYALRGQKRISHGR